MDTQLNSSSIASEHLYLVPPFNCPFEYLKFMSEKITSNNAPEPVGSYPHARKVGNLLFLSGVGPRQKGTKDIPGVTLDSDGNIIDYCIETQCKSVFNNVRTILEDSGSRWDQLVDVQVFLTNMKDDFKIYNKVYAEYFASNQPCRTTVEINCLPTPIAIELKCIAILKGSVPLIIPPKKENNHVETY